MHCSYTDPFRTYNNSGIRSPVQNSKAKGDQKGDSIATAETMGVLKQAKNPITAKLLELDEIHSKGASYFKNLVGFHQLIEYKSESSDGKLLQKIQPVTKNTPLDDDDSSHSSGKNKPVEQIDITKVTNAETIRSIVDNDKSWIQMRRQVRYARVRTNMGVQEACAEYIANRSEEIRKEKIKEAKRAESLKVSNLKKLRKRLSIFG